jgi:CheY-like chemotaxis protein
MRRAVDRGARLIGQLLIFSGRDTFRPEVLNPAELAQEVEALLRRAVGEAVEFRWIWAPDLWPVLVDAAQFEAALLNLIVNARDAMPSGGKLTIEMKNREFTAEQLSSHPGQSPGSYVQVSVIDTGAGMSPAVKVRAFEPFYTTKPVGKGTGLGLSQVYGFTRRFGGFLEIESEVGRGTTVLLTLPKAIGSASADETEPSSVREMVGSGTILAVEDDEEVREIVAATLRNLGYTVLEAADGVAALQVLEENGPIDLLFSDAVMPNGLTGAELARRVRELQPDIKILLTTGYGEAVSTASADDDAFRVLAKPYRRADLAKEIAQMLGHHSAGKIIKLYP